MINKLKTKNNIINLSFFLIGILVYFMADEYFLYVATSWLIFGILGLSLDLLWGKAGVLSLGQTVFYGLGGYVGAIASINLAPIIGASLFIALPAGILVGGLTATAVGYFIFYGKMGELQITILTYTLVLIVWTVFITYSFSIGEAEVNGDNGLSNIPSMMLSFGSEATELTEKGMFLTLLILSLGLLILCQVFIKTPFGKVVECIRQDANKVELLGYDIRKYQTILFTISGSIAGLGGALFSLWGNYLNPSIFSVGEALLVPIYVLVGGLGTLIGAFVGAAGIGGLSFYLGGFSGGQATLIIGVILILMVLYFDKGILGIIDFFVNKFRGKELSSSSLNIDIDKYEELQFIKQKPFRSEQVYKSFGGVVPVDNVDLDFKSGITCIIGPNGAGKSSYLKVCTGIYSVNHGKVFLDDTDITDFALFKRVHSGMGIKMQKPQVFKEFSIRDNIWISAYSRTKNKNLADSISDNMLEVIGGKEQGDRIANTLSHGEQQWLDIVMVLSLAPSVIFFDEPAAGMTKNERKKLSRLIRILSKDRNIILVEHDMKFVKSLNPKVVVLHHGSVFEVGDMDEISKNERVLDIYLGRK